MEFTTFANYLVNLFYTLTPTPTNPPPPSYDHLLIGSVCLMIGCSTGLSLGLLSRQLKKDEKNTNDDKEVYSDNNNQSFQYPPVNKLTPDDLDSIGSSTASQGSHISSNMELDDCEIN